VQGLGLGVERSQCEPYNDAMIVSVDVDYGAVATTTSLVGFRAWDAAVADLEIVVRSPPNAAVYRPGHFYERELPYLTAVLDEVTDPIATIVVDGYVWLGPDRPGLGWHLHAARKVPVVGVAKTRFAGSVAVEIVRGGTRPLFVTAIGVPVDEIAAKVAAMHGPYRIPTLLKRADSLARGHVTPAPR
jgi:deoxyribonuclease V